MSFDKELLSAKFDLFKGAEAKATDTLEKLLKIALPEAYRQFLLVSDGCFVNTANGFFSFWPLLDNPRCDETIRANNPNYDPDRSDFLAIGLDDCDDVFGFMTSDLRAKDELDPPVYVFLHEEGEYDKYGLSFAGFIDRLLQATPDGSVGLIN